MQDTMIQEQLLFAIDDIDDAACIAEASVMSKIADLYLRQTMIQESMTPEEFESFYAESTLGEKVDKLGEKVKNFHPLDILKGIWEGIVRVAKTIWANIKKLFGKLKPGYWKALYHCKHDALAVAAKKNHCKVIANNDGTWTLALPFLNFALFSKYVDKLLNYCNYFKKAVDDYMTKIGSGGKPPRIKPYTRDMEKLQNSLHGKEGTKTMAYVPIDQMVDIDGTPELSSSETNPRSNSYQNPGDSAPYPGGVNASTQKKNFTDKMGILVSTAKSVKESVDALANKFKKSETPEGVQALVQISNDLNKDVLAVQKVLIDNLQEATNLARKVFEDLMKMKGVREQIAYDNSALLNSKSDYLRGMGERFRAENEEQARQQAADLVMSGKAQTSSSKKIRDTAAQKAAKSNKKPKNETAENPLEVGGGEQEKKVRKAARQNAGVAG